MNLAGSRRFARAAGRTALVVLALTCWQASAQAQNKKNSWEIFLYFGSFYSNDLPSATQSGRVTTYRTEPEFALDPNNLAQVFSPNLGKVGGQVPNDPNYPFFTPPQSQFAPPPCNNEFFLGPPDPNDPKARYIDECDNDQESEYIYNASRMKTNGEIQRNDSEVTLGIRAGYNITRHWEVEFDVGFGRQRIDLTQNLDPMLLAEVSDLSDPLARDLADFYHFTWANIDYQSIVYLESQGIGEHPSVVASRRASDPNYTLPIYFPSRPDDPNFVAHPETFDDVTGFINRVFQDPTAFQNRGNQINIDTFTLAGSVNYNFNTKADSRIVPYLSAGFGQWIRNFDTPYDGENSTFINYGAGIRFFVNEIFAFRADARLVHYLDDTFTITGELHNFNLPDRVFAGFGVGSSFSCARDNRERRPPCTAKTIPASVAFPDLGGGGGNADLQVDAELDDFYEIRLGFDVILSGK